MGNVIATLTNFYSGWLKFVHNFIKNRLNP